MACKGHSACDIVVEIVDILMEALVGLYTGSGAYQVHLYFMFTMRVKAHISDEQVKLCFVIDKARLVKVI